MFLTTLTRQISSQLICHTIYIATQTFPYFHKPYFIAMKKKLSPLLTKSIDFFSSTYIYCAPRKKSDVV
ncbi:hypothetical protein D9I62_20775 [Escherichia coli]|nr:hypothetical protein [Escherichia coli]